MRDNLLTGKKERRIDKRIKFHKNNPCDQCVWWNYPVKICELKRKMGKICKGFLHWQTMMVLCEDCMKEKSLTALGK